MVEEAKEGGNGAKGQAAKIKGQAAEIEGLTQAGQQALGLQDVRGALACFRKAFLLSLGTTSPRLRRVCSFNLGAAYVEAGKPRKGLKFLLESQPVESEPLGGLYFNIGAAGEGLRDFPKALECFGQAAGPCRAGSQAVEMGCCYLGMQEPERAARCFLEAAHSYAVAKSPEAAAVALSRASGSMLQSQRFGVAEIARILTWCRSLCDSIADPTLRGNAAPAPSLPVLGKRPSPPGFSSTSRREALQRGRPRLLPAPRLLPGQRELRASPRSVPGLAGAARGGCAAAEPGRCPQRPAQLRHGPGLAPASGGAAR